MLEQKLSEPYHHSTYDDLKDDAETKGVARFIGRLRRYSRAHERGVEMAGYLDQESSPGGPSWLEARHLRRRANKLRSCGNHLTFRHYFTRGEIRLAAGMFCQQHLLCPKCAIRRGAKLLRKYTERVLQVMSERPGLVPCMVTHTVKDGPDLAERVSHLYAAIHEQHHRRRRHQCNSREPWTEACRAVGVVESCEVKRGENSGQWHPHLHAAWLCDGIPNLGTLRKEWQQITGDSHVVDVRAFHFVQRGELATAENVSRDFQEVFKYAVKLAGLPLADNLHAWRTLTGRHMITPRGCLFGVKIPRSLLDEPLEPADLPYVEWFYRYHAGRGYKLEHVDGDRPAEVTENSWRQCVDNSHTV
jgi:hypothetical protein